MAGEARLRSAVIELQRKGWTRRVPILCRRSARRTPAPCTRTPPESSEPARCTGSSWTEIVVLETEFLVLARWFVGAIPAAPLACKVQPTASSHTGEPRHLSTSAHGGSPKSPGKTATCPNSPHPESKIDCSPATLSTILRIILQPLAASSNSRHRNHAETQQIQTIRSRLDCGAMLFGWSRGGIQ